MIVKALIAAGLLAAPVSVAPASYNLDAELGRQIPKIVCPMYQGPVLLGWSMGTAFRIGPHLLLSVKHVTDYPECDIAGRKITVVYTSPKLDFSVISDSTAGPSLRVDCGGFVKGRKYLAIGHARGLDKLTVIELEGTGKSEGDFAILKGILTVIPGQSGGPVLDAETGRPVGTINNYDMQDGWSGSVQLKDTSVCGA